MYKVYVSYCSICKMYTYMIFTQIRYDQLRSGKTQECSSGNSTQEMLWQQERFLCEKVMRNCLEIGKSLSFQVT